MTTRTGGTAQLRVPLNFQLIRNTTSPDEKSAGVQSYVANLPAWEILKLDTRENLRSYIAEYNPRKRNRVHDAIRNTIETSPERFITRNGGFAITASDIRIDEGRREILLINPSLINGAQSQGEIRQFLEDLDLDEDSDDPPFHVRAEIIVDPNPAEVVETAIARNTATPVKSISQAGARGHLEELEKSIRTILPAVEIQKSETDFTKWDTRKILQWARLMMPTEVSTNSSAAEKLRAYKNPEQCLTDFSDWFDRRTTDPKAAERYEFTVQIAPYAIQEYQYWERHEGWMGHRLFEETKKGGRACKRDAKTGKIVWISPGLIYPILGAMSEFVTKDAGGRWVVKRPRRFDPDQMIRRAVSQFRAHNSDPMLMGRSEAAYDALKIYPQTLMDVLRDVDQGK